MIFISLRLSIIFIVIFTGCINDQKVEHGNAVQSEEGPISLVVDEKEIKNVRASEIFSSISYLPLDISQNLNIGSIKKFCATDNHLYILDSEMAKAVFIYNWSGKLCYEINKEGEGPGEYLFIQDFLVHDDDSSIEILNEKGQILQYRISGEYIGVVDLFKDVTNFHSLTDLGKYLLYTPNGNVESSISSNRFLIYDYRNGSIKGFLDTLSKRKSNFEESVIFSNNGGKTYFSNTLCDTIYYLENDIIKPYLVIDFKNIAFDNDFFNRSFENSYERLVAFNKSKGAFHTPNIFVNDCFLYTEFRYAKRTSLFYFKRTNKYLVAESILNDLDYGVSDIEIIGMFKNNLIGYIEPYKVIERFTTLKKKLSKVEVQNTNMDKFIEMASEISISDPPLIVILELLLDYK